MRDTAGHGYLGAENLSANWVRKRDRDLGNEGGVGHEAVEETACDTLHGHAVISILHVWTGRADKKGQVREVPAALRSTTSCMLGSPEERQAEDWGNGIPRDDEPDQESHDRRGRVLRNSEVADRPP
jgi:hypothetical protein